MSRRAVRMIALAGAVGELALVSEFLLGVGDQAFAELFIKFAGSWAAVKGCTNSQFIPGDE